MIWFEFWLVHGPIVPVVFSLGGHTDTYRRVAAGPGAFELCMPSLGFLFTKLTLRSLLLGQACRMAREPPFPRIGRRPDLEHYVRSHGGAASGLIVIQRCQV